MPFLAYKPEKYILKQPFVKPQDLAFSQVLTYDFSCILLQGRILMIAQKCYLFALSLDEL